MDRIYMTCMDCRQETGERKVAVFLKGSREHVDDLLGFLQNQRIRCGRFQKNKLAHMDEFAFFDDGFWVESSADQWSFYELRHYIQTYANTWNEDYRLQHNLLEEVLTCDEDIVFDDGFYLEISRKIDVIEDRYYTAGNSISQFFDGILKMLQTNLNLCWSAAEYSDRGKQNLSYQNHVPTSFPRQDVRQKIKAATSRKIVSKDISFNGELLARVHLCLSPYSPRRKIVHELTDYVIMHIDDFIFGIVSHQKELEELRAEIQRLTRQSVVRTPAQEERDRQKMRILLIGQPRMGKGRLRQILETEGFRDITLKTDYEKLKKYDASHLFGERWAYDGLLLGPMPHKVNGSDNLIQEIENNPDCYPPHAVLRDEAGVLKITTSSLKKGIQELKKNMEASCCSL